ncbi:DUF7521 family protein [Halorussus litoreus]|uniref:DUF7521 family protein n=1 Tax=Halorussus litoreus TaxID=1710536 RepID=UPI001E30CB28|nr:hypothetical protein [Halorussus litoreus]
MGEPFAVALQLSTVDLVFLLSDYVTILVSLAIAYIACRGYSRNDSRPMLYIAAGFVLAFGGPGGIFLVSLVVPLPSVVVGGITQFTEVVGMLAILYGFLKPVRT